MLLNTKEVSKILGVTVQDVTYLYRRGRIRIADRGKSLWFDKREIESYKAKRSSKKGVE